MNKQNFNLGEFRDQKNGKIYVQLDLEGERWKKY